MAKKKDVQQTQIVIEEMQIGEAEVWIRGTTPLMLQAMSAKVKRGLLYPEPKMTPATRAQTMKHDPLEEYRSSVYRHLGTDHPTLLAFPAAAFKSAMRNAALEIPGAKKSQIGRLCWVVGDMVSLYGIPELWMGVIRTAGMNHTPDIRTRAIVQEWACRIKIQFCIPALNETMICRLLSTAGIIMGVGDFRPEKGMGTYGQFTICDPDVVKALIRRSTREAQVEALAKPKYYNVETQELYEWFYEEKIRRGQQEKAKAAAKAKKAKK